MQIIADRLRSNLQFFLVRCTLRPPVHDLASNPEGCSEALSTQPGGSHPGNLTLTVMKVAGDTFEAYVGAVYKIIGERFIQCLSILIDDGTQVRMI